MTPTQPGAPVRVHDNITLIEVDEAVALDMLLADATAHKYLLTRLSDTVAVVAPGRFDDLRARLLHLGHTPKIVEEVGHAGRTI